MPTYVYTHYVHIYVHMHIHRDHRKPQDSQELSLFCIPTFSLVQTLKFYFVLVSSFIYVNYISVIWNLKLFFAERALSPCWELARKPSAVVWNLELHEESFWHGSHTRDSFCSYLSFPRVTVESQDHLEKKGVGEIE